nr:energy transducer TonB [Allomuricauda sp.]
MEPKKNQELELKRNSVLYFAIGLVAVLLLTYVALEWKSYHTQPEIALSDGNLYPDLDELPPVTIQPLPPPPPPKVQPVIFEIVPDKDDIAETVFASTETDYTTEIAPVDSIQVMDLDIPEEVSFIIIEDAPIFPGCENAEDKKLCFQQMMQKHIRKNFHYPEIAQEMGLQGRVNVIFTIQKDGSIDEVRMRGPHESLENEASRIISKLPKMTPGKQRGTPVKVPFSIPITFRLN